TIVSDEESQSLELLDFEKLGDACVQQQNDEKRKAVVKVLKLALEGVILILKNEPKMKERIMVLEVEQGTVNEEMT
ncbi:13271_t:CDS:2, partial [Cetraspora pellucida]